MVMSKFLNFSVFHNLDGGLNVLGQSEAAPVTAPIGRSVHRMGWMIHLFFIHLFTLHQPTFYHNQSFLAADL